MRKAKKDYYGNLNEKDVIDNKKFWKTVKPLFSDKVKTSERISLVHEDKIITMMFFAYVDVCGCFQWSFSRRMRIWSYEIGLYAAAIHCIKSVQIVFSGVFSGPYFPAFGLNTERYCSIFSPNTAKYGPEKIPYLGIFHAVCNYNWIRSFKQGKDGLFVATWWY